MRSTSTSTSTPSPSGSGVTPASASSRSTPPATSTPGPPTPSSSVRRSPSSSTRCRALDERGVEPGTALGRCELRLAATADQFATIATIRAARRLLARVAEVVGATDVPPVHAVTSRAMMTRYDPWVNALRSTVACFAAGVGGADAVTVLPHDALLDGSELGRRVARNTQSILVAESHLAEVVDPAGGSWYVERFTEQLAESAWAWFQEIEGAGGFRRAAGDGFVAERIAATAAARQRDIDTRRAPLTGLSEFPDLLQAPPPPADGGELTGDLALHRWSEGFEALRQRVDTAAAASRARPVVFLATIGAPAEFAARATFAENFFGVAGLACERGPVTDDPVVIAGAFTSSTATLACLCSSDARYATEAAAVAAGLESAGAAAVYLAGRPQAGIERTIHAGVDARAVLDRRARRAGGAVTLPDFSTIPLGDGAMAQTAPAEEAAEPWSTPEGIDVRSRYTADDLDGIDFLATWPGLVPYLRGSVPHDVRQPAVDDPPVRRILHGGGVQRLLPAQPGRRPEGALGRLRPGDPPRLRQRPSPRGGRRRHGRRGHRLDPRHAPAVRPHPARRDERVDDDERRRAPGAGAVRARRRGAGRGTGTAHGHDPERRAQGVHGPQHLHLPARPVDADHLRHLRLHVAARCPGSTRSPSPATTCRRPGRRRISSWPTRWPTASSTSAPGSTPASPSTPSPRGCRSSGPSA